MITLTDKKIQRWKTPSMIHSYVFIGDYENYPKSCSLALVIYRNPISTEKPCLKIFQQLGYKDVNDYVNTYPGNLSKTSTTAQPLIGNSANAHRGISLRGSTNIELVASSTGLSFQGYAYEFMSNDSTRLFITPTLKEISEIARVSKVEYKNLWFCSDWKE